MRFRITLTVQNALAVMPVNYHYPLSAAIYKIINRADGAYAAFLHSTGYKLPGSFKTFKLFTFSDIRTPFKIDGDRLHLLAQQAQLEICFHLPQAAEIFVRGLFIYQQFDIADKKSKARFEVSSIESLPSPLHAHKDHEIVNIQVSPLSPVVAGLQNEKGNYDFLSPDDPRFTESLVYNWRSKIATCFDEETAHSALLLLEVVPMKQPFKSRLLTIKADTPAQTKIRGWMNFGLKVTGEKRFVELLLGSGVGVYNSMGCGCVGAVKN